MLNEIMVIIGIACFVCGGAYIYWQDYNDETVNKRIVTLSIVAGVLLIVGSQCFKIIPTGYTGVRVTLGQINKTTVQNGFNFKIPFAESIKTVNNKQQDISFDGEIWSETSDRTAIYYNNVTITYQIAKDKSAWICANISNYEDTLVTQGLVSSAIKASSKTLDDTDATNRGKIEPLALENIQNSLDEKYGEGTVIVNKVVIEGADFTDTYNNAIAEKQNAQLEYEKQQIENQKNIETAEAEAEAKKIAAEGEKEANEILEQSLSDDIFKQMFYEKWDGALPKVVGDSDSVLDISQYIGDTQE